MIPLENREDVVLTDVRTRKLFRLHGKAVGVKDGDRPQLFDWIALHCNDVRDGSFYDERALCMYGNTTLGVGKSERSIRSMLGLSLEVPGSGASIDIDEEGFVAEVKDVAPGWTIRLSEESYSHWTSFLASLSDLTKLGLSDDDVAMLQRGELCKSRLALLPVEHRDHFQCCMAASVVLRSKPRICYGSEDAFVTIQYEDYDRAWIDPIVTQGGRVKYHLSRSYLVSRIESMLKTGVEQRFVQHDSSFIHRARGLHERHRDNVVKSFATTLSRIELTKSNNSR